MKRNLSDKLFYTFNVWYIWNNQGCMYILTIIRRLTLFLCSTCSLQAAYIIVGRKNHKKISLIKVDAILSYWMKLTSCNNRQFPDWNIFKFNFLHNDDATTSNGLLIVVLLLVRKEKPALIYLSTMLWHYYCYWITLW